MMAPLHHNDRIRREGRQRPAHDRRRGVTLIELLVVMGIMMMLAVIAIPRVRPAVEARRGREAARALSVYVSSARVRALETGRPAGIMIHRFSAAPQCSMNVDQVEVPPPYAGDTTGANVTVRSTGGGSVTLSFTPALNSLVVSPGDLIQFNHQGPWYVLQTGLASAVTDVSQGQLLPWPTAAPSAAVPYTIHRQPTKSAATPLQLPSGTIIDLAHSGTDTNPNWFSLGIGQPVTIMFSPNGGLDSVYVNNVPNSVIDPVYLLVGKREQVAVAEAGDPDNTPDSDLANFQIYTNFWIAIHPQTGLVTTAEVAANTSVAESRQFAREAQSMGGR